MNTFTETETKVIELISKIIGKTSELDRNAHLHNDLGFDSMDTAHLILSCEQTFNIAIPDEQLERCATVSDVINTVNLICDNR